MSDPGTLWSIAWPALAAGVLVTLTHVPLGMQVLARGIVFVDLAIAQIAGLGIVAAGWIGLDLSGWAAQGCALTAALLGASLLTWTDRRWPQMQEAIIGVAFVLAASSALLLLAANPHGGEQLKAMLEGQILWVGSRQLVVLALAYVTLAAIAFCLRRRAGRIGFYLLFACVVTASVQLVGLYLVFTTLIVPALATHRMTRHRLVAGYGLGILGYALGLALSIVTDLPSGPAIVWTLCVLASVFACCVSNAAAPSADGPERG